MQSIREVHILCQYLREFLALSVFVLCVSTFHKYSECLCGHCDTNIEVFTMTKDSVRSIDFVNAANPKHLVSQQRIALVNWGFYDDDLG